MTTVTLFAAAAGTASTGSARGRSSDDGGSMFGAALALAGETSEEGRASVVVADDPAPESGGAPSAEPLSLVPSAAATPVGIAIAPSLPTTSPNDPTPPPPGSTPLTAASAAAAETVGSIAPDAAAPVPALVGAPTLTPSAAAMPLGGDVDPGSVVPATRDGRAPAPVPTTLTASTPVLETTGAAPAPAAPATDGSVPVTRRVEASVPAAGMASVREQPTPAPGPSALAATAGAPAAAADSGEAAPPAAASAPVTAVAAPAPAQVTAPAPVNAPDAAAATPRAVAAQVSPTVVSIAQRPAGSHQVTMTVNPESLGPVTVRAHISASGDVQVELLGATDAGREALRTIVADLRRDLAAVMPNASLSLSSGGGADAAPQDRGMAQGADERAGGQSHPGGHARGESAQRASALSAHTVAPTMAHAVPGEGLDILV